MRNMTSNLLLSRAAKLVAKKGLAKDDFINKQGQTCAIGALLVAKYGDSPAFRDELFGKTGDVDKRISNAIVKGAVKKLAATLKIVVEDYSYEALVSKITTWSDAKSRRKGDVVSAFKRSITR